MPVPVVTMQRAYRSVASSCLHQRYPRLPPSYPAQTPNQSLKRSQTPNSKLNLTNQTSPNRRRKLKRLKWKSLKRKQKRKNLKLSTKLTLVGKALRRLRQPGAGHQPTRPTTAHPTARSVASRAPGNSKSISSFAMCTAADICMFGWVFYANTSVVVCWALDDFLPFVWWLCLEVASVSWQKYLLKGDDSELSGSVRVLESIGFYLNLSASII